MGIYLLPIQNKTMSNYKIFESVYVNECGKQGTPYFWIQKRKTFLGIPYWKSIRHYDGGGYTSITRFDSYDDALNFIQNVLKKGIKTNEVNTKVIAVISKMNNEKMNQMIDEAYEKYCEIAGKVEEPDYDIHVDDPNQNCTRLMTKEEFINKCKINPEFSERWGLKIEEREVLAQIDQTNPILKGSTALYPHKLITITYNGTKIESYE